MRNLQKSYSFLVLGVIVFIAWGCSTEKNAYLNRTYHGMTAKYNGYFNANELLSLAVGSYEKNRKEDFYEWLPLQPAPTQEESKSMYSAIDTAIVKCSKVIRNHSMPSAEGMKEAEYNAWIDENWLTIGRAMYYRLDYDKALKNFQFVKRFFQKDPSKYLSELWIAKIYIEENKLTEAKSILDELQTTALEQKKKTFMQKLGFSKNKKKKTDDDFKPEMNDKIQFEIYKARADLYMRKKQSEEAIFPLSMAVKKCKNKREKTRLSYILGQLYQSNNRVDSAVVAYRAAISPSAIYDVSFNAKLNCAVLGSTKRDVKLLEKMLKDEKNAAFKDQIYYAKAQLEQSQSNIDLAKSYYTLSAFYSTKNKRQQALSYEKLGDLAYAEKSYLNAQKYYDSCANAMPENYPNGDYIRTKASKLANLVSAMEIAFYEDSVQRIAKMGEKEQTAFIKDVIKKIKEDAQKRKELEAAKLRALQDQANAGSQVGAGDKWIFNNTKLKEEGYNEFRKQWGERKNEDDWRRSNKISNTIEANENKKEEDSLNNEVVSEQKDTLDIETMRKRLPLTDSLYQASVLREIEARYTAGSLYKDLLNEMALAEEQFDVVLNENTRNITDLSSAFQMYKMNEANGKQEKFKTHIITYYPKSDVANYFLDPNFFEKLKANKIQAEKDYMTALHEYEMLNYSLAYQLSEQVVKEDKTNAYRAEYLLLNILAFGQITSDKKLIIPKLKNLIEEKPGSPQADRAKELLTLLEKGVSKFETYAPKSTGNYIFNDSVPQFVFILLDEEEDLDDLKSTVANFTTKEYKKSKLKITSALTLKETNMAVVSDFKTTTGAQEFINLYKASIDILGDFQNNKIAIITQENLKKLIESDNFEGYKEFYDLNY